MAFPDARSGPTRAPRPAWGAPKRPAGRAAIPSKSPSPGERAPDSARRSVRRAAGQRLADGLAADAQPVLYRPPRPHDALGEILREPPVLRPLPAQRLKQR